MTRLRMTRLRMTRLRMTGLRMTGLRMTRLRATRLRAKTPISPAIDACLGKHHQTSPVRPIARSLGVSFMSRAHRGGEIVHQRIFLLIIPKG
jgi:hypothetical protein